MFDSLQLSEEYESAFSKESVTAQELLGWARVRPTGCKELLNWWYSFLIYVEDGYPDSWYEYVNDLAQRDLIESLIHNSRLAGYPEHSDYAAAVSNVDDQLKAILVSEVRNDFEDRWWLQSPPNRGSQEFIDSVPTQFIPFIRLADG